MNCNRRKDKLPCTSVFCPPKNGTKVKSLQTFYYHNSSSNNRTNNAINVRQAALVTMGTAIRPKSHGCKRWTRTRKWILNEFSVVDVSSIDTYTVAVTQLLRLPMRIGVRWKRLLLGSLSVRLLFIPRVDAMTGPRVKPEDADEDSHMTGNAWRAE